jgi:DNA-binding MarR family transcriptional regulator
LEAKKLVKRSQGAEDARQTVMSLTQAGISILESSTKKMDEIFDVAITLNESDAIKLNELLEKLRDKE